MMREEKVSKSEIGGRRMSRLRRFSKVAVDNKEGDKNKVKRKEADNIRVSEVDTVGRRISRLRRFSKVAVDNKEVDKDNKVKKKEADNIRVSEVDTVGRRMSRLRRLGTWYSEADLHRLEKQGTNNLIMSLILIPLLLLSPLPLSQLCIFIPLPVRRSLLCRTSIHYYPGCDL